MKPANASPRSLLAARLRVTLLAALLATLALLGLPGCDDGTSAAGLAWTAPEDTEMPRGFTEEDKVPDYATNWRMPEGFQGFPKRWNARVREYLDQTTEASVNELARAMGKRLTTIPGSEARRSADVRTHAAKVKLDTLRQRRELGDYLVFLPSRAIPRKLKWQDGQEQPEIGDPAAKKGGSIRIGLQRSFPSTLRPFGPSSNNSTRRYVYDDIDLQLVRIHPATGELIPGTADRWAISEDGRTVFFHIDPEARWSNGAKLTARDFVTSLYVRSSPNSVEPFYGTYYLGNFARIAIYGNHVLAVTLPAKKPYAPYYAAIPASCTSFYAEFGPDYPTRYLWRVPPTTGGYTVAPEGTIMGRQITMGRVRNWWARDRKFTRYSCNVDSIVYSFISETTKIRELFRIGELDIFSARDAVYWYEGLEIDQVHKGYIQRVHFSNIWPRNCFGVHLNCSRAPFNDPEMRIGFHQALNVQAVIDIIFRGDYTRMGSYFSGFGPYTDESIKAEPYNPELARQHFRAAGYTEEGSDGILRKPDGTRLQVVVSSRIDPLYSDCMNLLREDAARCGLDLRLDLMDDTVFNTKVREKQVTAAIYSWGFSPPLPDPGPFFRSQDAYREDGSPATNTNNATATASPEIDAAILACETAGSVQEAIRAHHLVQRLIANSYSWVPGWTTSYWRFAQWRWVRWPDTPDCKFCPPRYYDPLDSHLYWIDENVRRETQRARSNGKAFPEEEIDIPLPPQAQTPPAAAVNQPTTTDRT